VAARLAIDPLDAPPDWSMLHLSTVNGRVNNLQTASVASERLANSFTPDRINEITSELRSVYDRIIIDGGSVTSDPLALQLAAAVDGVVVAVRLHRTVGLDDRRAIETLERVQANVIGVVAIESPNNAGGPNAVDTVLQASLPPGTVLRPSLPSGGYTAPVAPS
jgi:MinD-like ATPase involved in chromosome partitioning or flagellar assembly